MSAFKNTNLRSKIAKATTLALVTVGVIAMTAGSASANTRTLANYSSKLQSISGTAPNAKGHGHVWEYKFTQPGVPSYTSWGAQGRLTGLPAGTYQLQVIVGTDLDAQGNPHQFTNYLVCGFSSMGNAGETDGCGGGVPFPADQDIDLSHATLEVNSSVTGVAIGALVQTK